MWVADDGSYGSGEIEQFDTSNWTSDDFRDLEDSPDYYRLSMARQINQERNAS